MAHAWKACWGQPLAGSNPASSAPLTSENAALPPYKREAAPLRSQFQRCRSGELVGSRARAVFELRARVEGLAAQRPADRCCWQPDSFRRLYRTLHKFGDEARQPKRPYYSAFHGTSANVVKVKVIAARPASRAHSSTVFSNAVPDPGA